MKKKLFIGLLIVYIIIVLIATKALLDKNENNVFVTKNYYYLCSEKIKEYDKSSLVRFDRKVDYEKMVEEEVYYFDDSKELRTGKLQSYDKENATFNVDDVSYKLERLLGKPSKAYQFIGSVINVMTSRVFYLIFFIVPIIALFVYEINLFVKYLYRNESKKDNDEKRKDRKDKEKKDK